MPTILRIDGFRFVFWSNERAEPPHVHVERGEAIAKLWLDGAGIASSSGFRSHEIARLRELVHLNRPYFEERWHEYFGRWNQGTRGAGDV